MTVVGEATLTLNVTLEEAQVLAQALDLVGRTDSVRSKPNRSSAPDLRRMAEHRGQSH